jgi:hypothetical protein
MNATQVIRVLQPIFLDFRELPSDSGSFRKQIADFKDTHLTEPETQALALSLVSILIAEIGAYQLINFRCSQCAAQMGIALSKLVVSARLNSSHGDDIRGLIAEHLHAAIYPRPLTTAIEKFTEAVDGIDGRVEIDEGVMVERDALNTQLGRYIEDTRSKAKGNAWKQFSRRKKIALAEECLSKL